MTARSLVVSLVISLALTVALELLFAIAAAKRDRRDLALVCMANVLTNPAAVLLYQLLTHYTAWSPALIVLAIEIAVVLAEARCYEVYGRSFNRPFLFSLLANLFSFGVGAALNALF